MPLSEVKLPNKQIGLKVGPFIGVSHDSARIWFEADMLGKYTISIWEETQKSKKRKYAIETNSDGIGQQEVVDLNANTIYKYQIFDVQDNELLDKSVNPGFTTFPEPGQDVDLSFAFMSCHKPFKLVYRLRGLGYEMPHLLKIPYLTKKDRVLNESSLVMWKKLASLNSIESESRPRFLLGIGDQIYADELWKKEGNGLPLKYLKTAQHDEQIEAYSNIYRKQLGLHPVSSVTLNTPVFFTWDDHEIRDGWGSHGDEKECMYMFEAATEAYHKYQLKHNPFVNTKEGYYAFKYGNIGFVVLDLRRYRDCMADPPTLLSDNQFDWLQQWLTDNSKDCRVVFIVCSVPLVHLSYAISRRAGKVYMKHTGLADDLRDQWNSKAYISDAKRFIHLLFDISNQKGVRIAILGGDVHVGTFAAIRSFDPKHELHPVIYQFTSSPISNKPTKIAKYLDSIWPEFEVGKDMHYKARLLDTFVNRNFGLVHIQTKHRPGRRPDYGVTFEIHQDNPEKPVVRFPTLW